MFRRLRRVAHAIAPKSGPQKRIIPSTNAHVTPAWKVATKTTAKNPHPRSPRAAKPTFVDVVQGCFPRLRQNRVSFWTVSGNATLCCRASTSSSHWSRLRLSFIATPRRIPLNRVPLDGCRNIAISLIWRCAGHLSVTAWFRQQRFRQQRAFFLCGEFPCSMSCFPAVIPLCSMASHLQLSTNVSVLRYSQSEVSTKGVRMNRARMVIVLLLLIVLAATLAGAFLTRGVMTYLPFLQARKGDWTGAYVPHGVVDQRPWQTAAN